MKNFILFFSSLLITAASQAQIPTNGLVGWWSFNGNANDESGNGNNGIANGAILTTDRFGKENKAYSFDGINDRIEVESSNSLNITGSISISLWVNSNIFSGRFVDKGNISSVGGYIFDVERGWFNYRFLYGENTFYGSGLLEDNVWLNLLVTHDSVSGLSKLYLNGILTDTLIEQQNTSPSNTPLWIGAAAQSDGYYDPCCFLNAKLDDIRIYNRDLTLQEIQALFHEDGWAIQPSVLNILYDKSDCKNDSISFSVLTIGIPPIHYQWQKDGADITGATDSVLTIAHVQSEDAGGYRCIVTNEYGTGMSNTALLWVEFAIPTYILGDTTVTLYQVATYSVDEIEGHTYEFMVEGGTEIDGTDNSITVHWDSAGMGFVKLIEMSELGCSADTNTLEVNIGYSGITELETQNLMVYPNPLKGIANFKYDLNEPSYVTLQVYNNCGQLVSVPVSSTQQKGEHQIQWKTGDLPEGIYFYKIQFDKFSERGKIMLVK